MSVVDWPKDARPILSNRDVTKALHAMKKRGAIGDGRPTDAQGMITVFTAPRVHLLAWLSSKNSMRLAIWSVDRNRLVPWEVALNIARQFAKALGNEHEWDVERFDYGVEFKARIH